jgi:hypothetical protein
VPADVPGTTEPVGLRELAEAVGLITAPAAGFATLAFYFGWRRTNTYAQYFGLDNSVLGFSFQEYVLRSAAPVYRIVQVSVAIGIAALLLHRLARRKRGQIPNRRIGVALLGVGGWLLLAWLGAPINQLVNRPPVVVQAAVAVIGAASVWWFALKPRRAALSVPGVADPRFRVPIIGFVVLGLDAAAAPAHAAVEHSPLVAGDTVLSIALAVSVYAASLLRRAGGAEVDPVWLRTLLVVFVGLFLTAGLFAATDRYAQDVGIRQAEQTVAQLPEGRGVVVYSEKDLGLSSVANCGVLAGADRAYRYRCAGLRLFAATERGLLVVPLEWSRADGIGLRDRVIVLPYADSVRVEFVPGTSEIPPG